MQNGTIVIVVDCRQRDKNDGVLWEGVYNRLGKIVTVLCTKSNVHYVRVGQETMPAQHLMVMAKHLRIDEE